MKWYEQYAKTVGVTISNDAATILDGLEHNKTTHGARYCPCMIANSKDTICPCRTMRDTKECHCGLFVK